MKDKNLVIISGRICNPVYVRTTKSSLTVANLRIASNRYNKKKEQFTTFIEVTLWDKQAEWAGKNLNIGDTVYVQGILVDDNFEQAGVMTTGRLKIDNAQLDLVQKTQKKKNSSVEKPDLDVVV